MRTELITHLQSVTGVQNWNSINFGIMPDEAPKGYLFLASSSVLNRSRKNYFWACAIAISAYGLNELSDQCLIISNLITDAFKSPVICIPNVGTVELSGSVEIESPQSYPNQGHISNTSGFFTAITFILEIN